MNGETVQRYSFKRDLWWLLSLFAAVLLVYLPFLGNPFVFDDRTFILEGAAEHYAYALFRFDFRWLPYASLGWTYALFGNVNTHPFHLGNTLLHGVNVILLFYLLRQLASAVIAEQEKSRNIILGAWLGALAYACHPVAVYAVGYVIQRSVLMAVLFSLVMQLAYLRALLTGNKRWLLLAVLAYFMAAFSKEHSVLLPAVLAAMTILLRAKNQMKWRPLAFAWGAFVVIGLLLVLSSKGVFGTAYEYMAFLRFEQQGLAASTSMLHLLSVLTQAGLFFKYLLLWVLPNLAWMSVDMREHFISSFSEWQAWAGALGFILYGVVAFRLLLRPRLLGLAGLALLYPWLQFWVEFTSIRVQEPFVLYRSYLWMPGIMLFFPLLLYKWPGKKTLFMLGTTAFLLLPLAWNRLWVFSDNHRLWNDAALLLRTGQEPGADRIFYNRGEAADLARKWDEAIADYQRAVALSPQIAPMRYALGMAYAKSRRFQEAIVELDMAIALQPNVAMGYYGKGLVLIQLRQRGQALQHMKKSCELGEEKACAMAAQI